MLWLSISIPLLFIVSCCFIVSYHSYGYHQVRVRLLLLSAASLSRNCFRVWTALRRWSDCAGYFGSKQHPAEGTVVAAKVRAARRPTGSHRHWLRADPWPAYDTALSSWNRRCSEPTWHPTTSHTDEMCFSHFTGGESPNFSMLHGFLMVSVWAVLLIPYVVSNVEWLRALLEEGRREHQLQLSSVRR